MPPKEQGQGDSQRHLAAENQPLARREPLAPRNQRQRDRHHSGQYASAAQGHRVLLDAAREVIEQEPRARFMLVGFTRGRDMEYKSELEAQAKRLGIADRVFIGPYAGAIGDVWKAADIAAHATLFDSLPNAIIEGMSLAKPAAVTAVGGILTLVSNEETGLVVAPGDPHAFADALLRLIRDPQRAKRLGETAFARYRSSYSAEQTAKKLESLFLEVAGAR